MNSKRKLAIATILKRVSQLEDAIVNCPLCDEFRADGCKGCPAKNAKYNCETYRKDIWEIRQKLLDQMKRFWGKRKHIILGKQELEILGG